MSDRLDRAMAVIDVGLQRAGDVAYGSDNGLCIRCQRRPAAEGSSWCEDLCDPAHEQQAASLARTFTVPTTGQWAIRAALSFDEIRVAFELIANELADSVQSAVEAISSLGEALSLEDLESKDPKARALARKQRPFTCHRHGVQPRGFCRACSRGR